MYSNKNSGRSLSMPQPMPILKASVHVTELNKLNFQTHVASIILQH